MSEEFQVILADPPWRYSFSKSNSRKIENQYRTMTLKEIEDFDVGFVFSKNSVLFLWATSPKLLEALGVMKAWGFEYKTHAIWNKMKIGMGYWFRGQHELLLVGTSGRPLLPAPSKRIASVISAKRNSHSKKPEEVHEWIEKAFPNENKLELFAREDRPGWTVWGDEIVGWDLGEK